MTKPKVIISVIIATRNESKNIQRLLDSLRQQTFPNREIILVDNFSTDNTTALAGRYTSLIYLKGPERSAQRNFGAKKATGKYLLFLDADMALSENVLTACVNSAESHPEAAVIIPEESRSRGFFGRIKKLEKRIYQNQPLIESPRFLTRKLFMKLGGYDQSLIAGEDWDLTQRIRKTTKIVRIKYPLFHHETSFFKELSHKIYYIRNIYRYAQKNPVVFKQQSNFQRIKIIFNKPEMLLNDIPATIGLLFIKAFEYLLYIFFSAFAKLNNRNEKK